MTDRPRYTAPMPDELRHRMRAGAHPARSVPCPHEPCRARAHRPCIVRVIGRTLATPHASRVDAWAVLTACCPRCQVEPTVPCHDEGKARTTVHARRIQEAEETLS